MQEPKVAQSPANQVPEGPPGGLLENRALKVKSANMPFVLVQDRGPAKHFHGREEVRSVLALLRADSIQDRSGTIFLVQGAPGAGKTALLYQCAVEAVKDGWHVARINNHALHAPAVMAQNVGEPYISREEQITKFDAKVVARETTKEKAGAATVPQVLKELASANGLLLVLDEVQTIRDFASTPQRLSVTVTLNAIHNGDLDRPVILLAGGLGVSEEAFGNLGISRFAQGCVVNLGPLSEVAERAVIHDWLVKDGDARGDVTPWIDAIAIETDGWPQHIMCFAQPAARIVHDNGGTLSKASLTHVLELGHRGKVEYYQGRADSFRKATRAAIANLLKGQPSDDELDESDILEALSAGQTPDDARRVLDRLLHKGIIAMTATGDFVIPIPSMRDWLVDQYGRDTRFDQ